MNEWMSDCSCGLFPPPGSARWGRSPRTPRTPGSTWTARCDGIPRTQGSRRTFGFTERLKAHYTLNRKCIHMAPQTYWSWLSPTLEYETINEFKVIVSIALDTRTNRANGEGGCTNRDPSVVKRMVSNVHCKDVLSPFTWMMRLTCFSSLQGEPGKSGEKGLLGAPGLRVSLLFSPFVSKLNLKPAWCHLE